MCRINKRASALSRAWLMAYILIVALVASCAFAGCAPEPLTIIAEDAMVVNELTLHEGQSLLLQASQWSERQSWSVEHSQIAEIEADGTLLARKEGVTTVTLTSGSQTATVRLHVLHGRCAWTIGDSIFDYRDNSESDMVQSIFNGAGYSVLCMDNLAGSTIRSARAMGIVDHISAGKYEQWEKPELIVIDRGSNDAYFELNQPGIFSTDQTLEHAVEQVCDYFRGLYPEARIVWVTPLYRADVPESDLNKVRETLHNVCPNYQVEVFDIHLKGTFANLNHDNHWQLLYDGIHLHDIGAADMITVFEEYLKATNE